MEEPGQEPPSYNETDESPAEPSAKENPSQSAGAGLSAPPGHQVSKLDPKLGQPLTTADMLDRVQRLLPDSQPPSGEGEAGGPVTKADVLGAIRKLDTLEQRASHRAVRNVLGRGSLTTIHKWMKEIETERDPELPDFELSTEAKVFGLEKLSEIFSFLGGDIVKMANIREGALRKAVELANARADDAIEAAETELDLARARERQAVQGRGVAEGKAADAQMHADEAAKTATRLSGQVELLTSDRDRVQERLEAAEEQITVAKAQLEAERRLREVAEAAADKFKGLFDSASQEIRILRGDLNQARSDLEAKATALAEMAVRFEGEIELRGLANKEIESTRGELARARAELAAAADRARTDLQTVRTMLNEALADVRAKDAANESLRRDLEHAHSREADLAERLRKASQVQPGKDKGNGKKDGAGNKGVLPD
jgi:DNA repair exonuclease SbcCD ATPase subunit